MLTLAMHSAIIISMDIQANVQLEGTNLQNAAAYNEWRRILRDLPNAILTQGMEVSLKAGAVYLRNVLQAAIPLGKRMKTGNERHLRNTGRVVKGRVEFFPSWLVKFGSRLARHYHLLEYGFTSRGGRKIDPTYILNNATQAALPTIDQIVAEETQRREPEIIRDARNRYN